MKKLLFIFPIIALLAVGCSSTGGTSKSNNQTQLTQPEVIQTPTPTPDLSSYLNTLKQGDVINGWVVESIDGAGVGNSITAEHASIHFSGEATLTGTFSVSGMSSDQFCIYTLDEKSVNLLPKIAPNADPAHPDLCFSITPKNQNQVSIGQGQITLTISNLSETFEGTVGSTSIVYNADLVGILSVVPITK